MKNIPELPCAIVEDLLPAYVERLTSEETTAAVEAHLASCPACAAKRAAMGAEEEGPSPEESAEAAREVDYLKAVRRKGRRRVWLAVLGTLLVLTAAFAAKIFVIGTPLNPDGVGVSVQREDDVLRVDIASIGSGNAFHGWKVQDEDGIVTITARSVLVVGRLKEDPTVRVVAQDKNSLAPEGKSIAFLLDGEHGFQWKGACDLLVDDVLSGGGRIQTKTTQMEEELERILTKAMPAEAVLSRARELGVSERTLMIAKKNLDIISEKRGGQWYWLLPEQGCKDVTV